MPKRDKKDQGTGTESERKGSILSNSATDVLEVEIQPLPQDCRVTHRNEASNQCRRCEDLGVVGRCLETIRIGQDEF